MTVPEKPKDTIDFGLCVAASFGKINTTVMVEWFELHKILGIKEFNIYNVSMHSSMQKVLQHYVSEGVLNLHHMPPIIPNDDALTAYMNSLPSLNHCLYTNMYRYKYLVIVDFDEFIIPKGKHVFNYTDLMKRLHTNNKQDDWSSFTFRNEFFFYEYPPDTNQPEHLPVMRQRTRHSTTPKSYQKSISNPLNCMIESNHACEKGFEGTNKIGAPPEVATNHHYRNCDFPPVFVNGKCVYLKEAIPDDSVLKYKTELNKRVKSTLDAVGYI